MRFSTAFSINRPDKAEWFDTNVKFDTPLFVNPFLIYRDEDPRWKGAQDDVAEYFRTVLELLKRANGDRRSASWGKAIGLLCFPEPNEFALGLSMGSPDGKGIGPKQAATMADLLAEATDLKLDDTFIGQLAILSEGVGPDGISDMICNILKPRFVQYTQRVANALGAELHTVTVTRGLWDNDLQTWLDPKTPVPLVTRNGKRYPVLLVPERFLDDIPCVSKTEFWAWAQSSIGAKLRNDFNYDLSKTLVRNEEKKEKLAQELAARNAQALRHYVRQAADGATPYDIENDPDLLVTWEESGNEAATRTSSPPAPQTQADFERWLLDMADAFKHCVEENALWRVLWDDELRHPRKESIVQVVARSVWLHYCHASNIDVSREAQCGRGLVDFKFSQGFQMRGLLEVKLMSNANIKHGADAQLPAYMKGEEAFFGIYLCVGYTDDELSDENKQAVADTCAARSRGDAIRIVPVFVDASPKSPASKPTAVHAPR
ncbi:hypothetical protein Srot_2353 [Segniliparus rotundus DSM 44985]|uniref:Uncharacterized protein n=1 Tax=Segniliparus rotundus (strain ATCC BAA-972 / CDC 1076 / CIP 108378 / DSM 44985 / JCM 13578) TaxID=640132 RepID=D6ZAR5_SEGRD|nr:hypothetical protein [Segniliparus rotundus]ADG98801.1 hypothetical protein Srot_2353 [Segniliparus rotundus DSM 44985]